MIYQLPIGMLGSNSYLILNEATQDAALVDPGFTDSDDLWSAIPTDEVRIRFVLNTHGHFDHVAGNGLLRLPDAQLGIHPDDRALLLAGGGADAFGLPTAPSPQPDLDLVEGLTLHLGTTELTVLHTPGHTPGSVCLYVPSEQALLTGDTLFRGGVGRTDLPGGSAQALQRSLGRILELPESTNVYPGHGAATTLQAERATNPWLRSLGRYRLAPPPAGTSTS